MDVTTHGVMNHIVVVGCRTQHVTVVALVGVQLPVCSP
jgi:hypothetical protein